ncbi:MAG: hypothetical protein Q7S83_01300 [bacterium]|nr:hypothetical protein [bacterium]
MKIYAAVTHVSRNSLGEVVSVRVVCHPYWAEYAKDAGRKLRWIDKGPKYRGAWPEIPAETFSAMRRRAYAEVFRKCESPAPSKLSKKPATQLDFPQQQDLFLTPPK